MKMMLRASWLLLPHGVCSLGRTMTATEIPWEELSEQLGPNVMREIASVEEVFEQCSSSIKDFGGALLPTVANGTCSFAGVCVFEDCGANVVESTGTADSSSVSGSGLFVESDLCSSAMASCAEAAPCYDHDTGICGADGEFILQGEGAGCATATPFCDECFPNSRCGAADSTPDESGMFVTNDSSCKSAELATCADAAPCYDHTMGVCGEDGVISSPDCAPAVPLCDACFPNSRCGAADSTPEPSGMFVTNDSSCGADLATCADAAPCYDHTMGVCGEDGAISSPDCAPAVPFCNPCFPNSRCANGVEIPEDSGTFVESDVCGTGLEGCADAAPCYDHTMGVCGEDGMMTSPECAPATPACDACFPNSRCGTKAKADAESDSGLFVESDKCPPELAGCAEAMACFNHSLGLCREDGSVAPDCAEAIDVCSVCFPNSRCGSGTTTPAESSSATNTNTRFANKNLPLYSIVATSIQHVQRTVEFAAKFGIPLSIKSTGASYSVANQFNDNLLLSMSEFPKHSAGILDGDSVAASSKLNGDDLNLIRSTITDTGGILDNYINACGVEHGPAIEIGGGETWGDVFGSLDAYNSNRGEGETKYMLSSGAAVTVGASGGWLQGGGLGPFDRSMGLGIDNVVAYKVVTADGSIKIANACDPETSDLMFALQGGGGGNFGVVVSQISKLHPIKPLVRANLIWMGSPGVKAVTDTLPTGITLSGTDIPDNLAKGSIGTRQNNLVWTKPNPDAALSSMEQLDLWWDVMLTVLNPVTMDNHIDGYYGIGCAWAGGYMCADLYYQGTMDQFESIVLSPLRETLGIAAMPDSGTTEQTHGPGAAGTSPNFIYIAQQYNDGYYSYASQDCVSAVDDSPQAVVCDDRGLGYPSANGYNSDAQIERGGYETRLSWMIPSSMFGTGTAGNPDSQTMERAKALFSEPLMAGVTGHVLGGVINDVPEDATSTSPVMRSSALEGLFPFAWIQALGVQESVNVLSNYLPAPNAVPIFNHDALNLDLLDRLGTANGGNLTWQELYWGSNLPRLREIKSKYDPRNVFQCRDCLTADSSNIGSGGEAEDVEKESENASSSADETKEVDMVDETKDVDKVDEMKDVDKEDQMKDVDKEENIREDSNDTSSSATGRTRMYVTAMLLLSGIIHL